MTTPTPIHRLRRTPNYDRSPVVRVSDEAAVTVGWEAIAAAVRDAARARDSRRVLVECYPGVDEAALDALTSRLDATVFDAADAMHDVATIDALVADDVTDDRVFGRMTALTLADFFDDGAVVALRRRIAETDGLAVVVGPGATLVHPPEPDDLVVYADMARWELQLRQRAGRIGNLGADNADTTAAALYKRAYFVDWRVADRHKVDVFDRIDLLLDTNDDDRPKLVAHDLVVAGIEATAHRPFRVVPFFDPGPWGGQWMREVCDLPDGPPNYAWCFDCVPEENSLLLGFGDEHVEIPSINVVFTESEALLGRANVDRFGAEFPIRFDFLDTVEGGNLSLQVHPLTSYIREHFGVHYTQDESYYMLDATADATVYLGLKNGIDRDQMIAELRDAQEGGAPFDAEKFVNKFPTQRHDHVLIPAGTVHCSGEGAMVLEISATPYIFTFKLWDWGRLGLDGRPRPINIDRGVDNIQWQRDTDYANAKLRNQVTPLDEGDGWRSERTGLHEAEFIETVRHWFTGVAPHDTRTHDPDGGVHVLNLVQGEEAIVESPDQAFEPFVVHYAETFIVPASVGPYTIRPHGIAEGTECATIEASVRRDTRRRLVD